MPKKMQLNEFLTKFIYHYEKLTKKKVSQKKLGEIIGISQPTVSGILNGKITDISSSNLALLQMKMPFIDVSSYFKGWAEQMVFNYFRILVVEDNQQTRDLYEKLFEGSNCEIIFPIDYSTNSIVDFINCEAFDAIILDNEISKENVGVSNNGLNILRSIPKNILEKISVIMITANEHRDLKSNFLHVGGNYYHTLPDYLSIIRNLRDSFINIHYRHTKIFY